MRFQTVEDGFLLQVGVPHTMEVHQTFNLFFINVSLFAPSVHGIVRFVRDQPFLEEPGHFFLECWEIVASDILPLSENVLSDRFQNIPPMADIELRWFDFRSEVLPDRCADNGSHVVVIWLVLGSAGG